MAMDHAACVRCGRVGLLFAGLPPAATTALIELQLSGASAQLCVGVYVLASLAAFALGAASVWTWWYVHRGRGCPVCGGVAQVIGMLEFGLFLVVWLGFPKC